MDNSIGIWWSNTQSKVSLDVNTFISKESSKNYIEFGIKVIDGIRDSDQFVCLYIPYKVDTYQIEDKVPDLISKIGLTKVLFNEEIKNRRKTISDTYKQELKGLVAFQEQNENATENYSYFPVVLKSEEELLKVQKALNEKDIFPRRYFYPSLDTLTYIEPKQECKISRDISKRILCLPIYAELEKENQDIIISNIKDIV